MGKKKRHGGVVLWVTVLAVALFTGCGSAPNSGSSTNTASYTADSGENYELSAEEGFYENGNAVPAGAAGDGEQAEAVQDTNRKLIKTVNMTVETKAFDEALASIENQVTVSGGYIQSMDTYNGSIYSTYRDKRESRNASLTARIPKDQLDAFLSTVSGFCNVISRSDSVEDITLTYVDLESHKKALETEQGRLLELLEKAESIEDIITVEQRLSDVRYQIDSMESQLRTFDNKVDYSTVYLEIKEVQELTPVVEKTVWQRISEGFMDSAKGVGKGFVEFVIWFLTRLPYLLVFAAVITGLIFLIIGLTKHFDKKRILKAQQRTQQLAQQAAVQYAAAHYPQQTGAQHTAAQHPRQTAAENAQQTDGQVNSSREAVEPLKGPDA